MALIKEPKMDNLYEQNLNWLKSKNFEKSLKIEQNEEEPECQNCGAPIHNPKNTTCPTCLENYKENEDDNTVGKYVLITDYGKLAIILNKNEPELVSGTLNLTAQLPNQMLYNTKGTEHEKGLEALLTKLKREIDAFGYNVETDITKVGKGFIKDYNKLAKKMPDIHGFEIGDTTKNAIGRKEDDNGIIDLDINTSSRVYISPSYELKIEKAKMTAEQLYNKFETLLDVMTEHYKTENPIKKK